MKPRRLLPPLQLAWLNELGADTHWLSVRKSSAAPVAAGDARPAVAGPAVEAPELPADRVALRTHPPVPRHGGSGLATDVSPVPSPATADLDALAQAISVCTRCPLHAQRTQAVPGTGVRVKPLYFIVGEQPGIEDDACGQPFQGDSGSLLRAMMAAARLPDAESAYLTTVVKCRAVGGRAPGADEIAACLPYLHREIALVRPRWILALGKTAAQVVLGSSRDLDALRGGPHAWAGPDGMNVPVWVTHHPSSLLVRSAGKLEAWRDLAGLAQAVRAAGI